jgi:hypothetical protein
MINYKKYSLTIKTGGNGGKWSVTVRNVWAIGNAKVKTATVTEEKLQDLQI